MASLSDRDFIMEIIEKYRERPCLWQVTHPSYHDKIKQNKALDDFLGIFCSIDANANRETVQKKLSSIRSAFNKEQRKVKTSLVFRAGSENVHVPKLWYFDHLQFLADQDTPRQSVTSASLLDNIPFDEEEIDNVADEAHSDTSQLSSATSSSGSMPSRCFKRPQQKVDQVLEKIAKRMDQPVQTAQLKQPFNSFGEHIAEKMRSLPQSMVPIFEKLINEAIFQAHFENLNSSSRIVTDSVVCVPKDSFYLQNQ